MSYSSPPLSIIVLSLSLSQLSTALISGFSWRPSQKWVPTRSYQKVLGVLKKEKGPVLNMFAGFAYEHAFLTSNKRLYLFFRGKQILWAPSFKSIFKRQKWILFLKYQRGSHLQLFQSVKENLINCYQSHFLNLVCLVTSYFGCSAFCVQIIKLPMSEMSNLVENSSIV